LGKGRLIFGGGRPAVGLRRIIGTIGKNGRSGHRIFQSAFHRLAALKFRNNRDLRDRFVRRWRPIWTESSGKRRGERCDPWAVPTRQCLRKLGRKLAFCSFSGHETLICLEQTAARLFPRLACIVRFPGGLNFNQVFRIRRRSQGRSGETTPLLET
jgi:hypothetical protein